jgi:hypothetical protein
MNQYPSFNSNNNLGQNGRSGTVSFNVTVGGGAGTHFPVGGPKMKAHNVKVVVPSGGGPSVGVVPGGGSRVVVPPRPSGGGSGGGSRVVVPPRPSGGGSRVVVPPRPSGGGSGGGSSHRGPSGGGSSHRGPSGGGSSSSSATYTYKCPWHDPGYKPPANPAPAPPPLQLGPRVQVPDPSGSVVVGGVPVLGQTVFGGPPIGTPIIGGQPVVGVPGAVVGVPGAVVGVPGAVVGVPGAVVGGVGIVGVPSAPAYISYGNGPFGPFFG